jgi:hypothetical protein
MDKSTRKLPANGNIDHLIENVLERLQVNQFLINI